jgi:hypothetical protein
MTEILRDLFTLYRDAFVRMLRSLRRGWLGAAAVLAYGLALAVVGALAYPFGLLGGILVTIADAVAVGALLALVEHAITPRGVRLSDIRESLGSYFWDVLAIGFILWIPSILVVRVAGVSDNGPVVLAIIYLVAAVFLNPLPEVIYQTRAASPLEELLESARFVQQHWIEWFLPIVLVAAPLGSVLLFAPGSLVRGGLSFGSILWLPGLLARRVAALAGLPPWLAPSVFAALVAFFTFALLLFRGHLFAALAGSTRRQRAYRRRFGT